jgi:hypothetical protein
MGGWGMMGTPATQSPTTHPSSQLLTTHAHPIPLNAPLYPPTSNPPRYPPTSNPPRYPPTSTPMSRNSWMRSLKAMISVGHCRQAAGGAQQG